MHDHITAAISAATTPELDRLVKAITAAWAAGTLDDDAFSAAYAAGHRRRAGLKGKAARLALAGRPRRRPPPAIHLPAAPSAEIAGPAQQDSIPKVRVGEVRVPCG